jgi:hypothetical protein
MEKVLLIIPIVSLIGLLVYVMVRNYLNAQRCSPNCPPSDNTLSIESIPPLMDDLSYLDYEQDETRSEETFFYRKIH